MPYRRAVPLVLYSCLLHWLLSQSFFLTRLEVRERDGKLLEDNSTCASGYSVASLLITTLALIGGSAVMAFVVFRYSKEVIPFGANCSLVLSAACHPPPGEKDPHLKVLRWGVVPSRLGAGSIGHCSLTSKAATTPEEGTVYA